MGKEEKKEKIGKRKKEKTREKEERRKREKEERMWAGPRQDLAASPLTKTSAQLRRRRAIPLLESVAFHSRNRLHCPPRFAACLQLRSAALCTSRAPGFPRNGAACERHSGIAYRILRRLAAIPRPPGARQSHHSITSQSCSKRSKHALNVNIPLVVLIGLLRTTARVFLSLMCVAFFGTGRDW